MLKTWLQTLLSALGVALMGFLSSVITARVLGPEGRGLFGSVMLLATLSAGVAQMGLGPAYVYHRRVNGHWHWRALLALSALVVAVLAVALSALARSASTRGDEIDQPVLLLLTGSMALCGLFLSISQLEQSLKTHNLAKISGPVSLLVGLLLAWQSGQLDVQNALWVQLSASIVALVILMRWILSQSHDGIYARETKTVRQLSQQVSEYGCHAFKLHSTILLGLVLNNVDKLYLYICGSIRDFGLYSVAFATSRLLGAFQETLSTTLYSRFAGRDGRLAASSVQFAFRITLLPMVLIALMAGWGGTILLDLIYGKTFAVAGNVFSILMLECVIGNGSWLLAQEFTATGKSGLVFARQLVSVVPVFGFLPFIPATNPLVGLALVLLSGSTVRLIMTLLLYKISLNQPVPRVLPTALDLKLISEFFGKK